MADPLRETIDHATSGDAGAIEALLIRFLPGLRGYLARHAGPIIGARESPDDLAQSVCLEVLERLGSERLEYRGEAQFRQWLYQAALHKLQMRHRYYRRERRDVAREAAPAAGDEQRSQWEALFAASGTPSQGAMRREDLARLQRAIEELPPEQHEIIRLARIEGLAHRDIAARLGVTESHARVLLARAMARLARLAQGLSPE